tara:strand:+ start:18 stop:431 length:414 start_codon:yes stop_codon:yes gene_type:complete
MNIKLEKLKSDFLLFDNQLDKFEYLIEIGKNNKGISKELKTNENLIIGCASKSWVVCHKKQNLFFIDIDSEAHIVRGLLSILQDVVNSKNSAEIASIDGMKILKEIGIGNSITSQRMNGFLSALETIKSLVVKYERN